MRDLDTIKGARRVQRGLDGGAFVIVRLGSTLRVIASHGMGWDHVSVSLAHRTPTWREMEHVKRLFFHDDETAMQLHVPPCEHISCHPYTLHIWRSQTQPIPRPPAIMVGPRGC
jgi:hypothetical protein